MHTMVALNLFRRVLKTIINLSRQVCTTYTFVCTYYYTLIALKGGYQWFYGRFASAKLVAMRFHVPKVILLCLDDTSSLDNKHKFISSVYLHSNSDYILLSTINQVHFVQMYLTPLLTVRIYNVISICVTSRYIMPYFIAPVIVQIKGTSSVKLKLIIYELHTWLYGGFILNSLNNDVFCFKFTAIEILNIFFMNYVRVYEFNLFLLFSKLTTESL